MRNAQLKVAEDRGVAKAKNSPVRAVSPQQVAVDASRSPPQTSRASDKIEEQPEGAVNGGGQLADMSLSQSLCAPPIAPAVSALSIADSEVGKKQEEKAKEIPEMAVGDTVLTQGMLFSTGF